MNSLNLNFIYGKCQNAQVTYIVVKEFNYHSSKTRVFLSSPRCLVSLTPKYIISVSNNNSKPLKSIYFTSDEFTCKNYKFSNCFSIKSSGQNWKVYKLILVHSFLNIF